MSEASRGPYAAPKAAVSDVLPQAASHWIRTKWFYLLVFGFASFVILDTSNVWLPSLGMVSLAAGWTLALLLAFSPLKLIAARRSMALPWWSEVLLCAAIAMALGGALLDDPVLLIIGWLPAWAVMGAITVALWITEALHPVKIYTKGRQFVFVEAGEVTEGHAR
jgi:hypothetical protein